jgi:hypothetical protein
MVPGAPLEGTMLAEGALPSAEIVQRIKEAIKAAWDIPRAILDFVYPVPGHPMMRPDTGFVEFVSFSFLCPSPPVNPEILLV